MAAELDPSTMTVGDVMSDEIATVNVDDGVPKVLETMRNHACRRVPQLDGGRAIGIITLDNLILDNRTDLANARSVIETQLETATRFKSGGQTHPYSPLRSNKEARRADGQRRRTARAESTYRKRLGAVKRHTGLQTRTEAKHALKIVLSNVCRNVTPRNAEHLVMQPPSKLVLLLDGPDERSERTITRGPIEADLRQTLFQLPRKSARFCSRCAMSSRTRRSVGETERVREELPTATKDPSPEMTFRRAG